MSLVSLIVLRRVCSASKAFPNLILSTSNSLHLHTVSNCSNVPTSLCRHDRPNNLEQSGLVNPTTLSGLIPLNNCTSIVYMQDLKSRPLCSAAGKGENVSEPKQSDKPSKEVLELTAFKMTQELPYFFINRTKYLYFRKDIILENRITGKTYFGITTYVMQMSLLKMLGHLRFSFVRYAIKSFSLNEEEGYFEVKWQINGMTTLFFFLNYMPLGLNRKDNVARHSKVWKQGISYYYVDGNGIIYKHIIDNKERDAQKTGGLKQKLKENIQKLAPKASPAM